MLAKISSILPSTPRITNVDVSSERSMRRGMPTFGLPAAAESNPRAEFKHLPTELAKNPTYDKSGQIGGLQKFENVDDISLGEDTFEPSLDLKA